MEYSRLFYFNFVDKFQYFKRIPHPSFPQKGYEWSFYTLWTLFLESRKFHFIELSILIYK